MGISNHYLSWVFSPHQIDYNKFIEGKHLVNHIEGVEKMVHKDEMVLTFRRMDNVSLGLKRS